MPPIIVINTSGSSHPSLEIELTPYNNPPNPKIDNIIEKISIGVLTVVPTFLIIFKSYKNVIAAIGATTWKSDLQSKNSTK